MFWYVLIHKVLDNAHMNFGEHKVSTERVAIKKIKVGFFQRICGELVQVVISRNNCAKSLSIKILHYIKKIADSDLAQ